VLNHGLHGLIYYINIVHVRTLHSATDRVSCGVFKLFISFTRGEWQGSQCRNATMVRGALKCIPIPPEDNAYRT
jgi:hypothetical protein